jgi:hypothetical protein
MNVKVLESETDLGTLVKLKPQQYQAIVEPLALAMHRQATKPKLILFFIETGYHWSYTWQSWLIF